jgi:trehalose 6-phosphate phosphatase
VDAAELVDAARARLPGLLVATDFDGTLAPVVVDPESSRPVPGAIDALAALARHGAHVVILTGRDAETVLRLSGAAAVPGIRVAGLYGLEQWHAGELDTPAPPPAMAELRERLPGWLRANGAADRVWVEDKRLSLVVHTRPAADPDAEQARLREPARALAAEVGVEAHDGRNVIEFRVPGHDKGAALRALAELLRPSGVLYAGDDIGDLPAFEAARGLGGWSIGAASAEVPELPADVLVPGPVGVVEVLRGIAAAPTPSGERG